MMASDRVDMSITCSWTNSHWNSWKSSRPIVRARSTNLHAARRLAEDTGVIWRSNVVKFDDPPPFEVEGVADRCTNASTFSLVISHGDGRPVACVAVVANNLA